MGPQVDVRVAQQRQDRMVERRRRQLDLPARGGRRVFRESPFAAARARPARSVCLVLFGEAAPLRRRSARTRGRDRGTTGRSTRACARPAGRGCRRPRTAPPASVRSSPPRFAAPLQQLAISRIRIDHPRPLRVEEVLDAERALVVGQSSPPASAPARGADRGPLRARTPRAAPAATARG